MTYDVEASLRQAAADAEARIALCHEKVACPKCGAPIGTRCRSMPRGYRPLDHGGHPAARELKHPHRQRWTQVVPAR